MGHEVLGFGADRAAVLVGRLDGDGAFAAAFFAQADAAFFFQAEDGIRCYKVTGVQTCALPILAGKSTLSRLEHAPEEGCAYAPSRYHKIGHDAAAIERTFVEIFLDSHRRAPPLIVLDLDATDMPLHGHQEGRFFHGYYDCYCYLPLFVFCGRELLSAKLRPADIDAAAGSVEEIERIIGQIRARW